jgi:hypothetical protein
MIKPISPDEIKKELPDEVISAFNALITKYFISGESKFKLDEVVDLILQNFEASGNPKTRAYLFENRLLDVESTYRANGWVVFYDKPGYCETYAATFSFRQCKK